MTEPARIKVGLGEARDADNFSEQVGVSDTSNVVPLPNGQGYANRYGSTIHGKLAPTLTGNNAGKICYARVNCPNLNDGHVLILGVNTSLNNSIVGGILARPRGNTADDALSYVVFSAANYTGAAGDVITLTVYRRGALDKAVTVQYATVDGTAVAGTDYTAASGTLTFAAGEVSKTIQVTTL